MSESAAAYAGSSGNAGQMQTGPGPESSQTGHGTPRSRSRTRASTSTAPNKAAESASTNEQTSALPNSEPRQSEFGGSWAAMTPAEEKMYKRLLKTKANRLIRLHGAKAAEMLAAEEAQRERRNEWVRRHGLACFKCGHHAGEWVAGGKRANGSLWVACKCIWRKEQTA